jgi:hypothetical protein
MSKSCKDIKVITKMDLTYLGPVNCMPSVISWCR